MADMKRLRVLLSVAALMFSLPLAAASAQRTVLTEPHPGFGQSSALSSDGNVLVVGAFRASDPDEGLVATAPTAGAAYVYRRTNDAWVREATLTPRHGEIDDGFGEHVFISGDGTTIAVSAPFEDSHARGVDGNAQSNELPDSGAVYVFSRNARGWTQRAYIKAMAPTRRALFGVNTALNETGSALVVASGRSANVYRLSRGRWRAAESIRETIGYDGGEPVYAFFGSVALSSDGSTLALGAPLDASRSRGPNAQACCDLGARNSGAAYVFHYARGTWTREAYLKTERSQPDLRFGMNVTLSGDGDSLLVGAFSPVAAEKRLRMAFPFARTRNADGSLVWNEQAFPNENASTGGQWIAEAVAMSEDGEGIVAITNVEGQSPASARCRCVHGDCTTPNVLYRREGDRWVEAACFPLVEVASANLAVVAYARTTRDEQRSVVVMTRATSDSEVPSAPSPPPEPLSSEAQSPAPTAP